MIPKKSFTYADLMLNEHFFSMLKAVPLCGNCDTLFDQNRKEFEEICKIINVFTVTFDQFNASLLKKRYLFILIPIILRYLTS